MIECLNEIGVDDTDLQIITILYWEQSAIVKTECGLTEGARSKRECDKAVSFHMAYSTYTQKKLFREVQDMKGVTIGGIKLNNLRHADDTALVCFCPTDIQELLNTVKKAGKPYGMEMYLIKTKVMVVSKPPQHPKQHYI